MFRSLLSQKYLPIRILAEGGMGEIYLARQAGQSGFQRDVVLKRIHRRLSEDPRAVEMFLDEARIAAALTHPNVVQIYDVGEEDGAYLIAMERVRGLSLRDVAETTTRRGQMIPMEISLTIIAQVLEGLRYAHNLRDESDRPVRIVHRDICPSNVLVSEDGVAKIADFGIARAESQLRHEVGPRPGKFAYMSPEAVYGEPMDARADLFSTGVLLYELTVGRRLFRATSFGELQRVIAEPIPPPTFARAGYPVDLEIVVMRSLERSPDDRFASAEEMLDALEQFAFDNGLRLSRLRVSRFMRRLVGNPNMSAGAELERPEPGREPSVVDELDFDGRGLFDRQSGTDGDEAELVPDPELERDRERSRKVREAVQAANEAIAGLVGEDDGGAEEQTAQIRISEQEVLLARSVAPEWQIAAGETSEPHVVRDSSVVVVPDELVEEEVDIGDPGEDLLPEVRLTGLADDFEPHAAVEPETDADSDDAERPRAAEPTLSMRPAAPAASADLIEALADIGAVLRAAKQAEGYHDEAAVPAVDSFGIGTQLPAEARAAEQARRIGAPPPAAVPPPSSAVPAPLLLDVALQAPAGPLTGIAPVRDELEAADGPSRRQLDDLELSDFGHQAAPGERGAEPQLEADGEPIVLAVEDTSVVGEAASGGMPPALPASKPIARTPTGPLALPSSTESPAPLKSGRADHDEDLDAPTIQEPARARSESVPATGRTKKRKRARRGHRG